MISGGNPRLTVDGVYTLRTWVNRDDRDYLQPHVSTEYSKGSCLKAESCMKTGFIGRDVWGIM